MNALEELFPFPLAMLAAFFVGSWFLMRASGVPLIAWLKRLKGMKWSPREDTPDSHLQKAGTPSMGGIGIVGSALITYVAVMLVVVLVEGFVTPHPHITIHYGATFVLQFLLFPILVALHAVLGFVDDWSKARGRGGLSSRTKLAWQILLGGSFLLAFLFVASSFAGFGFSLKMLLRWQLILDLLLIVGTSNAVNLSDGIDGLAAGLSLQCAIAFAFMIEGLPPQFYYIMISFPVYAFWLCLGGACLGFLTFNKNPARVFMGDTGSLALGAALGAGAVVTRNVALLPFIGFIFFVEMFSVIIQVLYFKITKKMSGEGKRVFKRAPLHHHFELSGWSEWRVVGTFWLVNAFTSCIGLVLLKMGYLPRFP